MDFLTLRPLSLQRPPSASLGSAVSSDEYKCAQNFYRGPQFSAQWHLWVRLRSPNACVNNPQLVCDQPDVVAKAQLMHYLLTAHLIISDLGKLAMEYLGPVYDLSIQNDAGNVVVLSNVQPLITSPPPVKLKLEENAHTLRIRASQQVFVHTIQAGGITINGITVNGFYYDLPKNHFQFFLSIDGHQMGSCILQCGVLAFFFEKPDPDFPLIIELAKPFPTKLNPSMFL